MDAWEVERCAVRMACSRAVLEDLRLDATDGFHRLAHGGIEIGGVLFGVRDPEVVKILAHRPLACEYKFGPSFTLSDRDRLALEELLGLPATDGNLSGMQPVGWYHSHTRSELVLSEKDLELFQHYFPENWQIALVLRPHRFDPVRAGVFFREPGGSMPAASPRIEFIVPPRRARPDSPSSADHTQEVASPPPASPSPTEPALPEPGPQPLALAPVVRAELEPCWKPAPPIAVPRRRKLWPLRAAAAALILTIGFVWIAPSRGTVGLSVRELDTPGQLRIDWDHDSRPIRQSAGGALEIEDGSVKVHDELTREQLRGGSITYSRATDNVLVTLRLRSPDRTTVTEISRFLGQPVATTAPRAGGSPDQFANTGGTSSATGQGGPGRNVPEPELHWGGTRRDADVRAAGNLQRPAASAPARRRFSPPPASDARAAEPPLPAPPLVTANNVAAIQSFEPRPAVSAPRLPEAVPPSPKSAPVGPNERLPLTGKIIWTGRLAKYGTVQIIGNHASPGHLIGELPGTPVRLQVFPSELTQEGLRIFTSDLEAAGVPEAPGAQNGWNRTVYVWDPRKAGGITIQEAPGQQNAWNRLVLRAEHGDHTIVVIRWQRIPAESALHALANR